MDYFLNITNLIIIYSILAISLNLVVGYTGLLSLMPAAFFGSGAYSVGVLMVKFDYDFSSALAVGLLIAFLFALLCGLILNRFKDQDIYLLATIGLGAIFYGLLLNFKKITNGPLGIWGIQKININFWELENEIIFTLLILGLLLALILILFFLFKTSFGQALKIIREDEKLALALGYNAFYFKLIIFIISALISAVAGAFFAVHLSLIDPHMFSFYESTFIFSAIIIGGLASLRGSILGAMFLILLPEFLKYLNLAGATIFQIREMLFGLILILLIYYRPQGILGKYKL